MRNMLDYYERLWNQLEPMTQGNFPPYDTYVYPDGSAKVVVALAGYGRDDVDVTYDGSLLHVRGQRRNEDAEEENTCVHRGIARRAFELRFKVPDNLVVTNAELSEGMLTIYISVDESKAPKQIPIL